MKIVVLDVEMISPGGTGLAPLTALGELATYPRVAAGEIVGCIGNADAILINKVPITRQVIEQLPNVKYIGITATGVNMVDLVAAREHGIVVTNVPAYSTTSVAQLTFGLILEITLRVGHHTGAVAAGRWVTNPDFSFWDFPLIELSGKTLGIVGFGAIGQAVAKVGLAFGMDVVAVRRPSSPDVGVRLTTLDEVLASSDVLSIHAPLTPETTKLINAETIAKMKPSAILINTSRGALIDEPALAEALNTGRLAAAGLDVLSTEPPSESNPLLTAKNAWITPHVGWATVAARERLVHESIENLSAFCAGRVRNVVN